jgi:arginine decarboxylase
MEYFDLKHKRDALWQQLAEAVNQTPFASASFNTALQTLYAVDRFWTYPGREVLLQLADYVERAQYSAITQLVNNCCDALHNDGYRQHNLRPQETNLEQLNRPVLRDAAQLHAELILRSKPYFEVLIVHPYPNEYEMLYRQHMQAHKTEHDEFIYDIVLVDCAEDALTAVLSNTDIQACVYLDHILPSSIASADLFTHYSTALLANTPPIHPADSVVLNLCRTLHCIQPSLNHYWISETLPTELPLNALNYFDRVLFHIDPFLDLHSAIMSGVRNRFSTPFFDALRAYSRQPKGGFHALPLSRGASVKNSPWINDLLKFYGDNLFLAETSSTQGGLDSLLDPSGAIKQAHDKAAETFGAEHSYFVTNGTSTSNKIVMQANLRPGDIVLISADCHKSIPYSVMLSGAYAIFLETYPLVDYDLYGGVDLAQIKAVMLDLKQRGHLGRLKQITLTNSTFDGLIYHCERFMMEILAIKPDIIFHWDEAWFAFAHFHPLYYGRTAMSAVNNIRARLNNPEYVQFYAQWSAEFAADNNPDKWLDTLYPDPKTVALRVYVTQSTHKTLTAFRQGSMIHITDDCFNQADFIEAFRIHTSTSPNYQIIASLDVGRRQVALEGMHKVRESITLSLQLRQRLHDAVALKPYFRVLEDIDLIPACYRAPHPEHPQSELARLSANWGQSDFVIDPTRITLDVSKTGIDGSSFRQILMSRYDIQINKTSRNTVLFLINIGATQATIDYLLEVLHDVTIKLQQTQTRKIKILTSPTTVILPEHRLFHSRFVPFAGDKYPVCDLRTAYFQGSNEKNIHYAPLSAETLQQVKDGLVLVSASFVTPYPPGFPVIVPGQIITSELLNFFQHIKIKEIHGFSFEEGFKVFQDSYLQQHLTDHTN